jgi:hypothetical protein
MVQVGKSFINERPQEINRECGFTISFIQSLWVWGATLKRRVKAIKHIPAIGRHLYPINGLHGLGSGFGILTSEASDSNNWQVHLMHKNEAHLQDHLELVHNPRSGAVRKGLCTVSTLQQKCPPLLDMDQFFSQRLNIPRRYQGWKIGKLVYLSLEGLRIWIFGHLPYRTFFPRYWRPMW